MSTDLWQRILDVFEDKMQLGFIQQARSVRRAQLEGGTLMLEVTTPEALEFFNAQVNQQRLAIMSRGVAPIDRVSVTLREG